MKRAALAIFAVVLAGSLFLYFRRPVPLEAPAAVAKRATIVQQLTTNGKVDPLESFAVHVQAPSLVVRVEVREGDRVRKGQSLAAVDTTAAREALTRAEAQLQVVRADRGLLERGGSPAELAELDAAIARARLEQEAARREIAALERLVERKAEPRVALEDQRQRLRKAETELAALDRKRGTFVGPEDRQRLEARIREAEAAVAEAASALQRMEIRAPAAGVVYSLALRPGAFYAAGEPVAQVGAGDKVRVRALVDEPELGRVRAGQTVRIAWDALPDEFWEGQVERLPSAVALLGTRSVGEVWCTIDNPGGRLLPGITVNIQIRTGAAENVLTIPREAVLRQGALASVLLVDSSGAVARQAVRLGLQDAARVQVLEGLSENQVVLLPGERSFVPGDKVQPKVGS